VSSRPHTHPFNGPLSRTTRVSRNQKGKTNLDFTEARDSEWQCHQLGRMQVCTSLQTDNHVSTPLLSFFTGQVPFLPPNQQRQSTEGISRAQAQCQIKVGAIDAAAVRPIRQEIGPRPRTRKRKVFSILVVISLVGTISGKSLKKFAHRCHISKLKCTKFDFGWAPPQTSLGELTTLPEPSSWI